MTSKLDTECCSSLWLRSCGTLKAGEMQVDRCMGLELEPESPGPARSSDSDLLASFLGMV